MLKICAKVFHLVTMVSTDQLCQPLNAMEAILVPGSHLSKILKLQSHIWYHKMFAAQVLQFVCLKQTKCFWYDIYIRESDLCRHSEASITMAKASCSHSVINLIENLFRSQSGGGGTWEASSILSLASLSILHSEFEKIDSPQEPRLCWITMVLGLLETSPTILDSYKCTSCL